MKNFNRYIIATKRSLFFCFILISAVLIGGCSAYGYNSESLVCRYPEKYKNMNTDSMCSIYFSANDIPCDDIIIEEFNKRNIIRVPREKCGQSVPPSISSTSAACGYSESYKNMDTSTMCTTLYENKDVTCDISIKEEFNRRNLFYAPKELCGQSLIPSPQEKVEFLIPENIKDSCLKIIKQFIDRQMPIASACDYRFNIATRESILCRKSINEFITLNSKGVGNNSSNCGLK